MNKKLIIEDWVLYNTDYKGFTSTDATTGLQYADIKYEAKELRVVGTKDQLQFTARKYRIDETYEYHQFKKGSNSANYYEGICFSDEPSSSKPTRQEYNAKFERDYKRYLNLYNLNNQETLILRTR